MQKNEHFSLTVKWIRVDTINPAVEMKNKNERLQFSALLHLLTWLQITR